MGYSKSLCPPCQQWNLLSDFVKKLGSKSRQELSKGQLTERKGVQVAISVPVNGDLRLTVVNGEDYD
uniref:Uncharacterized protein n=1 Tax=Oryza brachyantha TaxID=4533 RepID=J3N5E5_ORYBR